MKARIRNRFARVAASVMASVATLLVAASAYAQEAGGASGLADRDKYIALAAGLGLGIAAFGGALGQGRAAAAALDGIARNPGAAGKLFTPMILGISSLAFAQGSTEEAKELAVAGNSGLIAIAAGFGLGLAALGGALGQGRAAATALDGIARNPGAADKIRGPMILGLALIESLVIYSLIIAFLLFSKL